MTDKHFKSLLPDSGSNSRLEVTGQNSFGELVTASSTKVPSFEILIQPVRETYIITIRGVEHEVRYKAYCDYGLNIKIGDIITVNDTKYKVVGVLDEAGVHHHYKLLLTNYD
ncbi:MAG: ABC transporter permease [Candidatus Odinarchaeia archaeon]